MENASKALIIAGAILLAILLISLGIMIFTQAQDTVSSSGMTKAEIQSFNQQFTKYEGKTLRGSQVKALISEVNASNSSDVSDGNDRNIQITGADITQTNTGADGKTKPYQYSTNSIGSTSRYTVVCTPNTNSGYIGTITVTKNS